MKRKYYILLAVVLVIVGAGIGVGKIISDSQTKLDEVAGAEVQDFDLSSIADGVYNGSYKIFPISVKVQVAVDSHTITRIDLIKHTNGQGAGAEIIIDRVVDAQSLDVDLVSGATYSSKIILKAIENALVSSDK